MMMRFSQIVLGAVALTGCQTDTPPHRHGSPLHTYVCADGKTFQQRQIISGEVEVTAGGVTRDATNADGDPIPGGPLLSYANERTTLTGMPGGPYVACVMEDGG